MGIIKNLKSLFVEQETITAEEYLRLVDSSLSDEIEKVSFIPPNKIDSKNFGKFKVKYKHPVAKAY